MPRSEPPTRVVKSWMIAAAVALVLAPIILWQAGKADCPSYVSGNVDGAPCGAAAGPSGGTIIMLLILAFVICALFRAFGRGRD